MLYHQSLRKKEKKSMEQRKLFEGLIIESIVNVAQDIIFKF